MSTIDSIHPKMKVVLLDSHRPFHYQNLNYEEKIIILNDDSFKKREGKFPTKEEIEFLENCNFSEDENHQSEGVSKELSQKNGSKMTENKKKEDGAEIVVLEENLFVDFEEDLAEKIGKKRNKKKKIEKAERQKKVEEISILISSKNKQVLQRGFHWKTDNSCYLSPQPTTQ